MNLEAFFLINSFAGKNPILDFLAVFGANYLIWVLGGLILFLTFYLKNPKFLLVAFLSLLLALFLDFLIGKFISEPRPFISNGAKLLIPHSADNSFPSTHTAAAFSLVSGVWFSLKEKSSSLKRFLYFFFLLAFLVGFSRVYTGVHYPADVLAGAILGIFSGWVVIRILRA